MATEQDQIGVWGWGLGLGGEVGVGVVCTRVCGEGWGRDGFSHMLETRGQNTPSSVSKRNAGGRDGTLRAGWAAYEDQLPVGQCHRAAGHATPQTDVFDVSVVPVCVCVDMWCRPSGM